MVTAYQDVYAFMMTHETFDTDALKKDESARRGVIALLSAYQFLAVAVDQGTLGTKLVIPYRLAHMTSVWTYFSPFIEEMRESLKRPTLYGDLERFIQVNKKVHKYG